MTIHNPPSATASQNSTPPSAIVRARQLSVGTPVVAQLGWVSGVVMHPFSHARKGEPLARHRACP